MITKKSGTILINLKTKKIGLVYRKKKNDYSFPKGHLEKGETLLECAVRETEEETLRKNHKINDLWISLSPLQKDIIQYISNKGMVNTNDLIKYTDRSKPTILKILKEFEYMNLIEWVGTNEFDPKKKYRLK